MKEGGRKERESVSILFLCFFGSEEEEWDTFVSLSGVEKIKS